MYVCMYVLGISFNNLRMLWNMSDYIGTRIMEICECPESVADRSNGFGRVLGGKNRAKTGLAPISWKSASLQKMS